jgi:hypothetical protein
VAGGGAASGGEQQPAAALGGGARRKIAGEWENNVLVHETRWEKNQNKEEFTWELRVEEQAPEKEIDAQAELRLGFLGAAARRERGELG